MRCPNCDNTISDDSWYCNYCGEIVALEPPCKKRGGRFLRILRGILLVVLIVLAGLFIFEQAKNRILLNYDKLAKSVVKIDCFDVTGERCAQGSGVLVFENDCVVTNLHVVKDAVLITVTTDDSEEISVSSVVAYSAEKDLVALKLEHPVDAAPLRLGNSNRLKRGDVIATIGSPRGLLNRVSTGVVSGFTRNEEIMSIQHTAPTSDGSSGGALLNELGRLVGITYSSAEGNNISFAVPSSDIKTTMNFKSNLDLFEFYGLRHELPILFVPAVLSNPSEYTEKQVLVLGPVLSESDSELVIGSEANTLKVNTGTIKNSVDASVGEEIYVLGLFLDTSDGGVLYAISTAKK